MTGLERVEGSNFERPINQNPVRTAVRFPICMAVTIQTEFGAFPAFTENVSANGLLFICEYLPAINSQVEFTMSMPATIMGADKDVTVHCIGRIVRHEVNGKEKKAAAVIDEYFLKA